VLGRNTSSEWAGEGYDLEFCTLAAVHTGQWVLEGSFGAHSIKAAYFKHIYHYSHLEFMECNNDFTFTVVIQTFLSHQNYTHFFKWYWGLNSGLHAS
jgi:hypothetical protein